ncbi:NAD(P)-dependent oxidoreductase [Chitinophaga solisilvae]|uniref:NAD(P)-dependent oxidoreductase n=1 Tax=Chitinophaga solisilvae TaxID=1233460 RepID=A0A433WMA1_9BACT|nr:NAD(P)-binding domain-containing protein [Chitinophaga solisilvae]NSL86371.1 NAD(P)-dependent oxidoreductase [Chitinophaga solisilvae]
MEQKKVTVLGLGSMGAALAKAFIAKGYTVTVWNRDSAKSIPLVKAGATAATSAAEAILASEITIICVSDYKVTRRILEDDKTAAALKGRTIVQLSTGTPKEARDLHKWALQQGAQTINGAILAWPNQIGGEETTILVSGETAVYQPYEQLLKALAGRLTYMGEEPGSSAALFSAVLAYLAGSWIGMTHGALIAENEGLRPDEFGALLESISPILGAESRHMGEVIQHNKFADPESTVRTTGEDLHILVQQAHEAGINDELPQFAANIFQRAIDAGFGLEEHAAIIKVLRGKKA